MPETRLSSPRFLWRLFYLLRRAEDLKDSTPKFNLFVRLRKDDEL